MLKRLDFESDFFSLEYAESDTLNIDKSTDYDVIQYLSDIIVNKTILHESSFNYIDSKIQFSKKVHYKDKKYKQYNIEKAKPIHIKNLHDNLIFPLVVHSRFCIISTFDICTKFYKLWAKKAILGTFDKEAYIIQDNNKIVAFISLNTINQDANIGLLFVDSKYQGKGLAYTLLSFIENYLFSLDIKTLSIVTEGKNIRAINFYKQYGFIQKNINHWYYWRK